MKRLTKKDKGAFLLSCALNIYSECVLVHLLLIWRKGPQTWSDTKPEKYYADCSRCFLYSYITSYLVGTEKLLFWGTALIQSCLLSGSGWCWHLQVHSSGRALGAALFCPTGWAASSVLAQSCQSLGGGPHSSAKPPYPWQKVLQAWANLPHRGVKQHSYLSVLQDIWIFMPAGAVSKAGKAFLLY